MGFYRPGAFKNKDLVLEDVPVVEEIPKIEEQITVELVNNDNIEKKEDKIKKDVIDEELLVRPVENVVINEKWKKFKVMDDEVKVEIDKKKEIKMVRYLRHDAYMRRKRYREFLEEEWDNLWDLYDRILNYDINFLDKIRDRDDDKGFLDFTRLVFVSLKRY